MVTPTAISASRFWAHGDERFVVEFRVARKTFDARTTGTRFMTEETKWLYES